MQVLILLLIVIVILLCVPLKKRASVLKRLVAGCIAVWLIINVGPVVLAFIINVGPAVLALIVRHLILTGCLLVSALIAVGLWIDHSANKALRKEYVEGNSRYYFDKRVEGLMKDHQYSRERAEAAVLRVAMKK
jgi:hypothetical protein